jgi:hypothetical protein
LPAARATGSPILHRLPCAGSSRSDCATAGDKFPAKFKTIFSEIGQLDLLDDQK